MRPRAVFLHAHPDDESIFTGGTMRLLSEAGVEVLLVVATRGEGGTSQVSLGLGESMAQRRVEETRVAGEILGVSDVVFLGYEDSGMVGDERNDMPGTLWQAHPRQVGEEVARLCARWEAQVVVAYDAQGIYHHPDHVRVHQVGSVASEVAGIALYESTVDRDHLESTAAHIVEDNVRDMETLRRIGLAGHEVDVRVDVSAVAGVKHSAMAAHASQIPPHDVSLNLSEEDFRSVYGTEWYRWVRGERCLERWISGR